MCARGMKLFSCHSTNISPDLGYSESAPMGRLAAAVAIKAMRKTFNLQQTGGCDYNDDVTASSLKSLKGTLTLTLALTLAVSVIQDRWVYTAVDWCIGRFLILGKS